MKLALLVVVALLTTAAVAHAFGLGGLGNRFGRMGASGGNPGSAPVLTNLRITNTGALRITNTGANRAVFP